jgi:DNA-binding transcriptional LysR family regulator
MSGADDWTIQIERRGLPELKQLYKLYGAEDKVAAKCWPEFKHNYNLHAREMMYNWFNKHLGLGVKDTIKEKPFQPVPPKELSVFDTEHPLPRDALKSDKLRAQMSEAADKQIAALKSGQTDISFLRTPPQDPDLLSELAWSEGIAVVLPKGHGIVSESVTLGRLKDEKFVFLRLRDSLFARHILQCCIGAGFYPTISQQAVEAASLTSLVAAGFGVALIPEFVAKLAHANVTYRPVVSPILSADVHALYHLRSGPMAQNFLTLMRSDAERLAAELRRG